MKSYLINLDGDTDRLAFFSSNFKRLGLSYERVCAIDGRTFSDADYARFQKTRTKNYSFWLRGQMGCFLSHYHVWQKVAQSEDNFCAVFEDDIHASDDLKKILDEQSWIPNDVDIIRLETSTNRIQLTSDPVLKHAGRTLYGVKSTSWCSGAYILSRRAAQAFIDLEEQYHQPTDVIMYNFERSAITKKLNILQCYPAVCTQDKHLLNGNDVKFASNIEAPTTKEPAIKTALKYALPANFFAAAYRSLKGYRRITFE